MAPTFFLSYAREDRSPFFDKFFELLLDALQSKFVGAREGRGFFDTKSMEVGEEWPAELADALQECKVFLPVYTPTYFSRPYCGKEWAIFRARQDAFVRAQGAAGRPALVIPVLWSAAEDLATVVPESLRDLEDTHDDFGKEYRANGLNVLMRQNRFEDARNIAVEALARRIKRATDAYPVLPSLAERPSIKTVPPLFPVEATPGRLRETPESRGPRYVQFILVAGTRAEFETGVRADRDFYGDTEVDWQPYRPDVPRPAAAIAAQVAAERDFVPEPVRLDDDFLKRLEDAKSQNKIVVVIVDTWTLRIERYRKLMRDYDDKNFYNTAVLILWNSRNAETVSNRQAELEPLVKATFFYRAQSQGGGTYASIETVEDFKKDLGEALEAARRRMRLYADLQRSVSISPKPILAK
jgi:FxsC-like protein